MLTADEQYAANMTVLAANPTTSGMIPQLQQFPLTNLQLVPTPSGLMYGQAWDVASQQYIALVDPNDPAGQAKKDAESLYTPNAKVFSLLGMGLGYFVTEFAKLLKPYQRLSVWDLDPNMYKAMLYCCDVSPLFSEKHIDIVIGNDLLQQVEPWWLRLESGEKLHITPPMRAGYTHMYMKQPYDALLEKTVEMLRYHMVGMATWRMFGSAIGDNDLRNAPEYFMSPGYEHLHDVWKDQPAVCIAAGPSLHKNLRQLFPQDVRERIAIISAGTVYALLHGLGLEPDIVTTIDFQRLNWTDQFQHVPLDASCPLVYLHSTYPQTVRRWPGPRFVAENASDTTGWLRRYSEGKKSAAQVQTVAHLNVMVAIEMGANPIILLGQDLSMPHTEHHTSGARAQDLAPCDTPKEAFIETKDCYGQLVHTRHSFLSMKTVFERIFAENPDRAFLNCSEGGLALAGSVNMPLRVALRQCDILPGQRRHEALRPRIKQIWNGYSPKINEALQDDFASLCTHVDDLAKFSSDVQSLWKAAHDSPKTLTDDERKAILSAECDHWADVSDALHSRRYFTPILEQERILQERQTAFGLFAIRHFGIIEMHGEIPPKPEDLPTEPMRARFNAERLYRCACMIGEELANVRQTLREAQRRLYHVLVPPSMPGIEDIHELVASQMYSEAHTILCESCAPLIDREQSNTREYARLSAAIYEHTQQYDAALALYEGWGFALEHTKRLRKRLSQWRADTRTAIPAYFKDTDNHSTTMPEGSGTSATDWLID